MVQLFGTIIIVVVIKLVPGRSGWGRVSVAHGLEDAVGPAGVEVCVELAWKGKDPKPGAVVQHSLRVLAGKVGRFSDSKFLP